MEPAPASQAVRLLLVAEDPLARSGLSAVLSGQPGLRVVAQVGVDEVPAAFQAHAPEVAVWDLGLEPRTALGRLRAARPESLPAVTLVPDEQSAADALAAGARGVLLREADARRLGSAALAVHAGNLVIDEALASAVLPSRAAPAEAPAEPLTARELEVLQLLAQGMANKAIAAQLGISEHTAKFHVNAILAKLGVQSRTEAVVHAVRLGMVLL